MKRSNAFTLVEMLVVLAIVGLLAALLLPSLTCGLSRGASVRCHSRLKQWGLALSLYVSDNNGKYPHFLGPIGPSYGDDVGLDGKVYWSSKLFPYTRLNWTNPAAHCPGYKLPISGPVDGGADRRGSYGYNTRGAQTTSRPESLGVALGLGPIVSWTDKEGNPIPATSENQVRNPSEMLAIGDSATLKAHQFGSDFWNVDVWQTNTAYLKRHETKYNQLYSDGHVSSMLPSQVFNPAQSSALWNYDNKPHPELWE